MLSREDWHKMAMDYTNKSVYFNFVINGKYWGVMNYVVIIFVMQGNCDLMPKCNQKRQLVTRVNFCIDTFAMLNKSRSV